MKKNSTFIKLGLLTLLLGGLTILFPVPTKNALAQCPTSGNIKVFRGFLSVAQDVPTGFFVDPDPTNPSLCLYGGDNAMIAEYSFKNYAALKSIYYDRNTLPETQKPAPGTPISLTDTGVDKLYNFTGNLTIDSNSAINSTGVVFVDGDLLITSNITRDLVNTGLVFIVGGNVYIDQLVNQVNAFIITHQEFCSASAGSLPAPSCLNSVDYPLTINGSVILLNNPPAPIPPPGDPKFVRTNGTNDANSPGETINFQAKYLVILTKFFAQDLISWSEVE